MKRLFFTIAAFLTVAGLAQAEPRTSVTQTSPNHTKIVIIDNSPQAVQNRDAQVREAREMREREKQRAHEIELARIRAGQSDGGEVIRARQVSSTYLPSIEERRKSQAEANQPSYFMNGGVWTGGVGGFGGWGYGPGYFGPGFVGPAFGPGFVSPGFAQPIYNGGYRGAYCGPRGGGYRGGYRGGYCGGGYRGGYRGGGFRGCR